MIFKQALVTGASSGIGQATARALAEKKINLILLARRRDRLEELAKDLRTHHNVDIQIVVLDLADPKTFVALQTLPSTIDILINNAGLAKGIEKVQDAKLEDWQSMIDTNVSGLLRVTRALLPKMILAGRGHIVNVGSVAGRWVYPGGAVYCASKFAVRAISEGLRMDLLGTPIRVTNIEPGMVETEFSEVRLNSQERAKSVYKGMTPLSAVDVAETILWSLSRPAHVNIQELVIMPTDQAAIGLVHRR